MKYGYPAEAFSAIRFTRAVATWDYESAAHAADTLIAASRRGENWVAPELLRDGTVTAKLMTGDVAGARRTMIALAPLVRVAPGDLRARLLASYVVAVEQAQQPQPEIRPDARR